METVINKDRAQPSWINFPTISIKLLLFYISCSSLQPLHHQSAFNRDIALRLLQRKRVRWRAITK